MPTGDTSHRADAILVTDDARSYNGGALGRGIRVLQISADDPDTQLARREAAAELARRSGLSRTLSLTAVALPFIDVGDSVLVRHRGAEEIVEVASWSLTLDAQGRVEYSLEAVGWTVTDPSAATPLAVER